MIVDTLVVELGLDPKQFTDGQRDALNALRKFEEAAEGQGKRVESQTKRLNEVFSNFKRQALETVGILVGGYGVKEMIANVTNLDASVGRLGHTMNMSAGEVSAWQNVIKQVGGSAEEANSALAGLSGEVNRFAITGQSSILGAITMMKIPGGFYKNGRLKTPDELLKEMSTWAQGKNPAEATAMLSMIPGMNTGMINALLEGPASLEKRLADARRAGVPTAEDVKNAQEFQTQVGLFTQASTALQRALVGPWLPALTKALNTIADSISSLSDTPEKRKEREERDRKEHGGQSFEDRVRSRFGEPPQWLKDSLDKGIGGPVWGAGSPSAAPRTSSSSTPPRSGTPTPAEMEAFIRKEAMARNIDPDQAVRVARSEGLFAYKYSPTGQSFVPGEQSFGPFQLNYAASGRSLGDKFTRMTGFDARDPSTWQEQVKFSLDEASKGGWGPWHGWKGSPWAGIGALGNGSPAANSTATTVNVGTINVNAPQAKDADGVGRAIVPSLRRAVTAGSAQTGPL